MHLNNTLQHTSFCTVLIPTFLNKRSFRTLEILINRFFLKVKRTSLTMKRLALYCRIIAVTNLVISKNVIRFDVNSVVLSEKSRSSIRLRIVELAKFNSKIELKVAYI